MRYRTANHRGISVSAYERTGWRDEKLSARHRLWGHNCPMVDLDFLVVEYNHGKPVGLIEFKHFGAEKPDIEHPTYRALIELSNLASLPFLVVFYDNEDWWFRVYPINDAAKVHYKKGQIMSEREFVRSLYRLRGIVMSDHGFAKLNVFKPEPTAILAEK